ncbi:hypothetical protein BKA70DRAFT_1250141 [Coprinopsis sp. MPI-PUGE-AT-0042]|nr:hypothetical protein BKA70DRAFT_1250141 [Coprinopsis sp. MPI-PUGE-AT-0042]
MAPGFFSKLVKSGGHTEQTTSSTTTEPKPTTTTTTTKPSRRRTSRDRSGSRKPSEESSSPRPSFQFGISSRVKSRSSSISKNTTTTTTTNHGRAVSTPSAPDDTHTPSTQHTKAETFAGQTEGLKVERPKDGQRSRRNSIISVFKKENNNSIVRPAGALQPQLSSVTASSSQQSEDSSIPRISVAGSTESLAGSSHLGVTVIPPSPLVYSASLASSHEDDLLQFENLQEDEQAKPVDQPPAVPPTPVTSPTASEGTTGSSVLNSLFSAGRRARTVSVSSAITGLIGELPNFVTGNVDTPTSEVVSPAATSPVTTPTTATTIKAYPLHLQQASQEPVPPVPERKQDDMSQQPKSNGGLAPAHEISKKSSTRSLNNIPPPLNLPPHGAHTLPRDRNSAHNRAATSPPDVGHNDDFAVAAGANMSPIVESPTAMKMPEYPSKPAAPERRPTSSGGVGSGFAQLLSPRKADDDAVSVISTSSKVSPEKKSPWKRNNTRKPTGLAGAIAASGMAFANPGVVVSPVHASPAPPIVTSNSSASKSQPYLSKSPARSTVSTSGKSMTTSPKSAKSSARSPGASRQTLNSAGSRNHRRRPSVSAVSDGGQSAGHSEYYSGSEGGRSRGRRLRRYQSGSESDTESDSDSDSDDDSSGDDILDGLDLGDDDMPVTGFAVASNKRNADFHELFPTVPEGDYLIEDYGCALQREILIQGRLYISENHVCFHANIFGWITNLSIPIPEIIALEKRMTAFVIPNAIQITTRQAKYTFASFLSRDTTFDVIHNIWRVSRPDDVQSISSARGSLEGGASTTAISTTATNGGGVVVLQGGAAGAGTMNGAVKEMQKKTQCACGRDGKHYTETAMDTIFPGSPEKIHNLMFASGFIKDFLVTEQKLLDLQMSDWAPTGPGSKLLTRNMSYIKPLNASMGPKQTKCEIKDEVEHLDLEQYVSTISSTRTPDVPSGGVFTVKTRTCVMWASAISSRVMVTTQVDWSGRSFIKGIIERSAIDGQKVYHSDLEKAMRNYIHEHKSEFVPEGMDTAVLEAAAAVAPEPESTTQGNGKAEANDAHADKQRERERNRRAFQWAYDTVEGVWDVAKRSTSGVVELLGDAWDESSSTTILYFVIVILVISNLYTLVRMGKKEDVGRRKEMMKAEERERWVQSVVVTLWDELVSGKKDPAELREQWASRGPSRLQPQDPSSSSIVVPAGPTPSTIQSWKEEVAHLQQTLAAVEERVRTIRESIKQLEKANLDSLD